MKRFGYFSIIIILVPALAFSQLKTDVSKPNISKTLETYQLNDAFTGFLDPSRFSISHSLSMSYMTLGGGGGTMINTYVNTLNYRFSDNLSLTTNLGIMNSPYNSLSGNSSFNEYEFFGGAELKYLPSENSVITLRYEKVPAYYYGNQYNRYRSPFGFSQMDW